MYYNIKLAQYPVCFYRWSVKVTTLLAAASLYLGEKYTHTESCLWLYKHIMCITLHAWVIFRQTRAALHGAQHQKFYANSLSFCFAGVFCSMQHTRNT
jgi:hypothetical protein